MAGYLTPVDIANRALQHCGATQIDATQGFAEQSTNAFEISSCYDKLRMAELQRNTWRVAIKEAILRPIDSNTALLSPTMWVSTVTYFKGSIVQDQYGTLWQSNQPTNLGNNPLLSNTWDEYFGPMTVPLYDSSTTYFNGELVYIQAGDGTFKVYRSLANSNAVDPSLSNQWIATTTYKVNDVVQQFPAWSSLTTYSQGQGVLYTDGNVYASLVNSNLNNAPISNPSKWALVPTLILQSQPVPSTTPIPPIQTSPVVEWSSSTVYALGNVVMFNAVQYLSIQNNNSDNYPNAAASTFWVAITGGTIYMSLINFNVNNSPASAPALWSALTTYSAGQLVGGSDGSIYSSIGSGNLGNDPTKTTGFWTNTGVLNPWTTVFTLGGGNSLWLLVGDSSLFPNGVNLVPVTITYPVAIGPLSASYPRSVYRLPAGFLRTAPRDPKAGQSSYLGSPTNLQYDDWEYEGEFFRSIEVGPIAFRFVADITDVSKMGPMLCEAIAARIGYEICPRLTQSEEKTKRIISVYQEHATTARLNDAIVQGATEPPLDDYIATRY